MSEKSDDSNNLNIALIGTLIIADAICIRLWFIMDEIKLALTDPNAMAFIITNDKVISDNKTSEKMLQSAKSGFFDAERALLIFSVCLALISFAMIARIFKEKRRQNVNKTVNGARKRVLQSE